MMYLQITIGFLACFSYYKTFLNIDNTKPYKTKFYATTTLILIITFILLTIK